MIIPKFLHNETIDSVFLSVYTPRFISQHVEFYVDKADFYLFAHPYCLKIRFPIEVAEKSIIYKPEVHTIEIELTKKTPGSADLVNFINYKNEEKNYNYVPLLDISQQTEVILRQDVDEFDINCLERVDSTPKNSNLSYGFTGKVTGAIENLDDGQSFVTVPIELFSMPHVIREARLAQEVADFDYEIYQDHTYDTEQDIVDYKFSLPHGPVSEYYPVAPSSTKFAFALLSQISFAWAYENRFHQSDISTTLGEMVRLYSPTLSWLDHMTSISLAIHDTARRMLVYAGCRSWEVIDLAFADTKELIANKQALLVALNRVNKSLEVHYSPISSIYTEPLIGWLNVVPDHVYHRWIVAMNSIELNPELMCLFD